MSVQTLLPVKPKVVYPDSDGQPMAENAVQFRWIVTIEGGLEAVFRDDANVFVAGDLLWYPVEGDPTIRMAPDILVAFGRPKGDRGSYQQWLENNIPLHVVFEVYSPGNRFGAMLRKFQFYERYGVEEYYLYDPEAGELWGWLRDGSTLREIENMSGWVSPRMKVRFELVNGELQLYGPDGNKVRHVPRTRGTSRSRPTGERTRPTGRRTAGSSTPRPGHRTAALNTERNTPCFGPLAASCASHWPFS
jgi:Uma2 family endonuclease